MPRDHDKIIADGARYFSENNTPLSRVCLADFVEHYVSLLTSSEQERIGFANNRPSKQWIVNFAIRNNLKYRRVQQVEAVRAEAVS